MNGRRAVIGLSLLCALAFSAFAAPSASAIKGTTAFTCVKEAGGKLRGEHCLTTGSAAQEYTHEAISEGTTTEVEGTNEKTAQTTTSAYEPLLTGTLSGTQAEISCETEASTGSLKNETTENAEKEKYMRIAGFTEKEKEKIGTITITYTNCAPKGVLHDLGCVLVGGKVQTEKLSSETKNDSMTVDFKPPASGTFAVLEFEKCSVGGLNETPFKVTGTAKAIPEGATLRSSALTTSGLKFGGTAATLTSAHTVRMSGGGNPISITTTEP